MAHRVFGDVDEISGRLLSCTGEYLVFPHHENEIAQSEAQPANSSCATGFTQHLKVEGDSSKSKGSFYVRDLSAAGFTPAGIRYFFERAVSRAINLLSTLRGAERAVRAARLSRELRRGLKPASQGVGLQSTRNWGRATTT
jgi:cysteinyl-tRNA synthetase